MATRLAPARPVRAPRPDVAPAPAPEERRHLRVVPKNYVTARTRRNRARLLVLLTGVLIAAALFGVVAFHVVLTQNQLDIQHLQAEESAASVKQQQLRLQVAELESPERVVDAAQKMGMVPPATVHYLSPNGAVTTTPKPAPTTVPTRTTAPKASTVKPAATKKPVTTTPKLTGSKSSPSTTALARPTR
jgi:cell division protein FtsL